MEEGESMANTHSHLTLSDRIYIEQALERRMKFKDIALFIEKDPTTVSKEIRRHRVAKESGRKTALCENRSTCTKQYMCRQCYCNRMCGKCTLHYCHSYCEDYSAPVCRTLCLQWLWDPELQAGYKVLLPRTDSRERLPRIAVRIPQGDQQNSP